MSHFFHVRCQANSKDFSTCTFLFQDDVGGLEVEDPVCAFPLTPPPHEHAAMS
jgi:isopenicillin N synthase-like dioxygenase